MRFKFLKAIILLGVTHVQGFGSRGHLRALDLILYFGEKSPAAMTKNQHIFSSTYRRSKATILRYRNSPDDTVIDYYSILGIPRHANDAEIKRAYRNLAKQFHPDANPDMDTTSIFQQLNRAYEVLKDKELRNQFDIYGSSGLGTSASSDHAATARNVKRPTTVHRGRDPFHAQEWYYERPPQTPPRSTDYQPSPFDTHFHPNAHQQQPNHSNFGPRPQRPDSRFSGDSPYESSWDPWKSPFADVYKRQQTIYESSNGVGFDAPDVEMGHTDGRFRRSVVEPIDINTKTSTTRPYTSAGQGSRRRWVGGDLSIEMDIDLQTALEGGEERIRIKHLKKCTTCSGDGIQPGVEVKICDHCHGTGAVTPKSQHVGVAPTDNHSRQEICPHCRGTGQIVPENCMTCHGKGVKETSKEITVLIPAGVGEGAKLRLKGEGDDGPMGGPAGDLFIFLTITKRNSQHVRMP